MKTLPWGAILVSLPLLFFASSSLLVLFSTSTLLIASSADEVVTPSTAGLAIFLSAPPEEIVLGESVVSREARPIILKEFLESYHSPMVPYSDFILETSEKYGLDWRLLTAISGNESLFGRVMPPNPDTGGDCYNAWGWGIHSRGTLCFSNWKEGIETVARGIKENYIDQGLTTVDQIMLRYAPVSVENGTGWNESIKFFMERLENAENYRD